MRQHVPKVPKQLFFFCEKFAIDGLGGGGSPIAIKKVGGDHKENNIGLGAN